MPLTLPATFSEGEHPHSDDQWYWMVEVMLQKAQSASDPALILRVVNYKEPVIWPIGNPTLWQWEPFNFDFSPMVENQEGDLPRLQLTVDNSGRDLMQHLHDGDGLEGNTVTMYLVPRSGVAIAWPNHEYQQFDFQIASAAADDEVVTFTLERANFFTRQVPQDRYSARRCRWVFGGGECGYVQNAVAAYTQCDKTLDDCILRGDDHVTRGLPRLHPRRFGGFPGIPKQR